MHHWVVVGVVNMEEPLVRIVTWINDKLACAKQHSYYLTCTQCRIFS